MVKACYKQMHSSKTSLTMDAKTRFTPYAALGSEVQAFGEWADRWLKSREDQGLIIDEFFLPSFFSLNAAWLNGIRCPGGRPSVS